MLNSNTIKKLTDKTLDPTLGICDIIICASKTRNTTVWKVDEIANEYDFHTIWISSFVSPNLNHQVLNNLAANNIINIINSLMIEEL